MKKRDQNIMILKDEYTPDRRNPPAGVRSHGSCLLRTLGTGYPVVNLSQDNVCRQNLTERTSGYQLTQVRHIVAGSVEGTGIELQTDDGEDDDGEEEEESDVDQRTDGLGDGGDNDLET